MKTLKYLNVAIFLACLITVYETNAKNYTKVNKVKYAQGYLDALISEAKDISNVNVSQFSTSYYKKYNGNNKEEISVISCITTDQIKALSTSQIKDLSTDQIKALSTDQVNALTTEQIPVLTKNQIQVLSVKQIKSLSTDQANALTDDQKSYLSDNQSDALPGSNIILGSLPSGPMIVPVS